MSEQPKCTATWDGVTCGLTARHEDKHSGPIHQGGCWVSFVDSDDGATPHREPENNGRAPESPAVAQVTDKLCAGAIPDLVHHSDPTPATSEPSTEAMRAAIGVVKLYSCGPGAREAIARALDAFAADAVAAEREACAQIAANDDTKSQLCAP